MMNTEYEEHPFILERRKRKAAEVLAADLENQIAELCLGLDQAKSDVDEMEEALAILISAARGMPISHDNLCQGTLNWAIDEAEKAISGDGSRIMDVVKAAQRYREGGYNGSAELDETLDNLDRSEGG